MLIKTELNLTLVCLPLTLNLQTQNDTLKGVRRNNLVKLLAYYTRAQNEGYIKNL